MMPVSTKTYAIGEVVLESGMYRCVPCGYFQRFEAGAVFETCEACYAGTEIGPAGYQEPEAEFWGFVG